MDSKLYKFDHRAGLLDQKFFFVRDYWQYYTTGAEDVVTANPDLFRWTQRDEAERAENIMNKHFKDPDMADVFVGLNNQNFLWATPFDHDAMKDAIEFRMNYLEYLMKDRLVYWRDKEGERHWNRTAELVWYKCEEDIQQEDQRARTVIVPNPYYVQDAFMKMTDYFDDRVVK